MIRKIPANTKSFEFFNANPKDKRSSDCVLRALSSATDLSWDDVLDELVELAHEYKVVPEEKQCYSKFLESHGFVKKPQPRLASGRKYTGTQFCRLCTETFTNGEKIVAHIGGHHIVAILPTDDGYKVHDTWDSTSGCIGNYWVK